MRGLKPALTVALGAALIPATATATAAHGSAACAALKGRDLAKGPEQRAVRRGAYLYYCARGGPVRRLGGAAVVRGSEERLLLLHRRGRAEVLDVRTGRRATIGPIAQVVDAKVDPYAGVAAVRRTSAGDAVVIVAPGRTTVVVERGVDPVTRLSAEDDLTWERAGRTRTALLPRRGLRCADLRGDDELKGPGRVVSRMDSRSLSTFYTGCAGAPDGPTYDLGEEAYEFTEGDTLTFDAGEGSWLLRETAAGTQYSSSTAWETIDLATGRVELVNYASASMDGDGLGGRLDDWRLLADGRFVSVTREGSGPTGAVTSNLSVRLPGRGDVTLARTEPGTPTIENLRVDGGLVRFTVGGEERSAPLP